MHKKFYLYLIDFKENKIKLVQQPQYIHIYKLYIHVKIPQTYLCHKNIEKSMQLN